MSHVQIDTTGIGQKTAVTGRLVVSPVMDIENTALLNVKEVVSNLMRKPGGRMFGLFLIDQEPVLGFKPENTVEHISPPPRIEGISAGDVKDHLTSAVDI